MTSTEQSGEPAVSQATMVPLLPRRREAVRSELTAIATRATKEAKAMRRWARAWSSLYFIVGLPAAILAAVAGATALASTTGRVAAGIIALISAGLTAAATFLDSATRQTRCENLAAGWDVLASDVELKFLVDCENDEWLMRESRVQLEDLANRRRKLLQGKAPDAEAEAERRAEREAMRAHAEAQRAEAEAKRARAAEQEAKTNLEQALKGRALAAFITADDEPAENDAPSRTTGNESPF
jgi:hypothetical protein